jgi:hypothetical protein
MRVEIRLANQADFDQVGKIFAEENQFHADLVPEVIQTADPIMSTEWFDDVLRNPHKAFFVAQIDKELVGLVLVELKTNIEDPIFKPRKYMNISEIAVAASHRGLGIGRRPSGIPSYSGCCRLRACCLCSVIRPGLISVWSVVVCTSTLPVGGYLPAGKCSGARSR